MKLDGEKLLADLELDRKFTDRIIKKISQDDVYLANKIGHHDLLVSIIGSIKLGDYTIKDKTERTTNYKPTAQEVKSLREKSAFGMKACKEALRVCNGIEKDAHEYLVLKYSI